MSLTCHPTLLSPILHSLPFFATNNWLGTNSDIRIIFRRVSKSELPWQRLGSTARDSFEFVLVADFSHSWLHCLLVRKKRSSPQLGHPENWLHVGQNQRSGSLFFMDRFFAALFVVEELVDEQIFSEASLVVSHLVYDGLTFLTRAPETTLIFYKRDLHKYCYTLHTMRT